MQNVLIYYKKRQFLSGDQTEVAVCESLYSPEIGMVVYSRTPSLRQPDEKEVDYTFHGDILEEGKAVRDERPPVGVLDIRRFQYDIAQFLEFVNGLNGASGNDARMMFEEFLQRTTEP